MSGVSGLVLAAEAAASRAMLRRMMAATSHRAVHGSREISDGAVAFGHQLLDVSGDGPSMGAILEAEDCLVTADCRLDNRDELIAALGVAFESGDTELILAAYRRWDLDAPARLLGDFAFALWDRRRERLLCARDHFGVKPFYFHQSRQGFAFASEAAGVLASGLPRPALNEDFVAAHLAGLPPRAEETVHREIARLPPAHLALVQHGRLETRPYWRLEPIAVSDDEDVAEGLRRRLQLAVGARMRGAANIGSKLSGGLDSSAVTCLAASLRGRDAGPLPTFSMVYDETPHQSERPQIEAVLDVVDAEPHFLPSNRVAHLADLPALVRDQNGPFIAPNLAASRRIYAAARDAGVAVLLDGHGGDEAISTGAGHLAELAAQGRWLELRRQLAQLEAREGWPARKTFWSLFGAYAPAARLVRPLRKLRARLRPRPSPLGPDRFLSPAFAARAANLRREAKPPPGRGPIEQARHMATVTGPLQAYAMEIIDKAAARAGVEDRFPFWDKRVVEFCCSVAAREKLMDGQTRALLRRSMRGVLPESIRNRPDKFDFMPHFVAGLRAEPAPAAQEIFPDGVGLDGFLALGELRSAYERLLGQADSLPPLDVQALWRCAAFAWWWRHDAKSTSAP